MQKYIVFITEELSALPSLDHPRDRREEPVCDGQQRLVEVRARVDTPGRRDEDVEHPGAADVDAHARDRGVAGGDFDERRAEVLEEQAHREHLLVDRHERLRLALEGGLEAALHRAVAAAHGHAEVPGEDAVVHEHAVHDAVREDVRDRVLDALGARAPAEERRGARGAGVEVRVLRVDAGERAEEALRAPHVRAHPLLVDVRVGVVRNLPAEVGAARGLWGFDPRRALADRNHDARDLCGGLGS